MKHGSALSSGFSFLCLVNPTFRRENARYDGPCAGVYNRAHYSRYLLMLIAISTTILILVVVRIVQGVGWGLSNTASGTIASDLVPKKTAGEKASDFFGLSGNLALAIGPALGLFLVNHIEFSTLFIICGSLTLIALVLALNVRYVKPEPLTDVEMQEDADTSSRFNFVEKEHSRFCITVFHYIYFRRYCNVPAGIYIFQRRLSASLYSNLFTLRIRTRYDTLLRRTHLHDRRGLLIVFIPVLF